MFISNKGWLYLGQSIFGLLIGFMVGLSISPVVSTVLGLMFAFIGGSLPLLIKNNQPAELEVIGKCVTALSVFMIIGVVIGITARANDVLIRYVAVDKPLYELEEPLGLEDIKEYGKKKKYIGLICSMIKDGAVRAEEGETDEQKYLSKSELKDLVGAKVHPAIIFAMLGYDINCQSGLLAEPKGSVTHLLSDLIESE